MAAWGWRQRCLRAREQRPFAHYKRKAAGAVVAVCAGVTNLGVHEGQYALIAIADTAWISISGISCVARAANKKAKGKGPTLCSARPEWYLLKNV